jgi:hypothetical protein
MPVTATMSATCVTRGMPVNVTVKTRPQASLAGAVEYADEDAHGNYAIGSADGTGTWRWPFVVSTEAPIGRAVLGVSAQDRTPTDDGNGASTTGEEGSAQVRFEVKKSC